MAIDWDALLLGFSFGVPVSMLFFAGLAWGMRRALRSARPGVLLLLSSACRIAVLLAVGFRVTAAGDNAWPLVGYALAFLLVRLAVVIWVRAARIPAIPGQEGA